MQLITDGPDYFQISRERFLSPANESRLCVGEPDANTLDICSNCPVIKWGELDSIPVPERYNSIFLLPGVEQLKLGKLPAGLNRFKEVRSLHLPSPLILGISADSLPQKVSCVTVSFNDANLSDLHSAWPSQPISQVFGLRFIARFGIKSEWDTIGWDPKKTPNLRFLGMELDGRPLPSNMKKDLPFLEHLELNGIHGDDSLQSLPSSLKVLAIHGAPAGVYGTAFLEMPELRALLFNGVKGSIEFSKISMLPKLVSLEVRNCKSLIGLEALLDSPTLRNLIFVNCGKPFKGGLKQKFLSHGFEKVNIQFS